METCLTPFPKVTSAKEVAGGGLKKFPERLFAVPPRIAKGLVEGVTAESYQEDNKLWKKHVNEYKRINRLIGTTRYRNVMDMNAGLGGFAAALESPKSWVMNVVPTIARNTLGVIYERGLVGIYHDWYVLMNLLLLLPILCHLMACGLCFHLYFNNFADPIDGQLQWKYLFPPENPHFCVVMGGFNPQVLKLETIKFIS